MLKFYNRENEIKILKDISEKSMHYSQMTVISGRRRVGKTSLIKKTLKSDNSLYFFVSKKNEKILVEEFLNQITEKFNYPFIGQIKSLRELFELIMVISKNKNITVVFDEFQELYKINPSIFSDLQNIWDSNKNTSKLNLILCGSVFSMMKKIFENLKEPLFGRADNRIYLKPFDISTLKNILFDNKPNYLPKDLFAFYTFTGGIAKYIEYFLSNNFLKYNSMIDGIVQEHSLLLYEGKNNLIEEFGKDYSTYFSILTLLSKGKTSRSEIESILQKNIGGYLKNLEEYYNIIKKYKPVLSKPETRLQKYYIDDNFFNFWFRFIFNNYSAIEIGNYEYVKKIIHNEFDRYSGKILEKYFKQKLAETKEFSLIGSYWEKGNTNEIDIVALNQYEKKCLIGEVKLNKAKINFNLLKEKSINLIKKLPDYNIEYKCFSLENL